MTDLQLLWLVLALLYLWECAWWLGRGAIAFRTWFGLKWASAAPGSVLGNQRGGFVFAHPLPPLGSLVLGSQLPVSLGPEAVLAHVAVSVNPGGRPPQSAKLLLFSQIKRVDARAKKVMVDGEFLVKAPSAAGAERLTKYLNDLAQLPLGKRAEAIAQLFRESLDAKAIERRWKEFQGQSTYLRPMTNLLFVFLFVAAPLIIWQFGFSRFWPALLVILFAGTCSIAAIFWRAHGQLYPTAADERFSHCLMLALYPALAIRAQDLLSRPLLESFHPLALAKVFCPEPAFREFASRMLRELRYPALPLCPRPEPVAHEAERHSRLALLEAAEAFLRKSGVEPDELLRSPTPTDESCRSFCPRCLAQFTTPAGTCADCGGVTLSTLPRTGNAGQG